MAARDKRKPGTRRGYLQILKAHVLPALGAMELDQVTRRDVQLLINRLHNQSKARHTRDNVRNLIRSLFRQEVICGCKLLKGRAGGMGERLKPAVLKTVSPERGSGVRIPLPPPLF